MSVKISSLFIGFFILLWTICNASPLKRLVEYHVAGSVEPHVQPQWQYLIKRNSPTLEAHGPHFHLRRRKREEGYDQDSYEYPGADSLIPYKNIGSLYVDADNLDILDTIYNFGAEKYPKPDYPSYKPSS